MSENDSEKPKKLKPVADWQTDRYTKKEQT